jgi:hypothetical protein
MLTHSHIRFLLVDHQFRPVLVRELEIFLVAVASLLFHLEGYKLGKASVNCLCLSLDVSSDGFVLSNFVHEDTSLVSAVDNVLERPFVTILVIEIESQSTHLCEPKLITVLVPSLFHSRSQGSCCTKL